MISFKSIYGGADAGAVVRPVMQTFKNGLSPLDGKRHSPHVDEILINFFVDGDIDEIKEDPNGAFAYRVMKKARRLSADLTMHREVWEKGPTAVREFLAHWILTIVKELSARAEAAGLQVDREELIEDVQKALGG